MRTLLLCLVLIGGAQAAFSQSAADIAQMRDEQPAELQALAEAPCETLEACVAAIEARWALAAPDGAAFAAELAPLQPEIDKLVRGYADLGALVRSDPQNPYLGSYYRNLAAAETAEDPVVAELLRRVGRDQLAQFAPVLIDSTMQYNSEAEAPDVGHLVYAFAELEFRANADWLQHIVEKRGWFTLDRDGAAAADAAWLIAQHADHDPEWQSEILALIEPLAFAGKVSLGNYAYLFDRVAVNAGRPQRYGTQLGSCSEELMIEPPIDELDARRGVAELEPWENYRTCPP